MAKQNIGRDISLQFNIGSSVISQVGLITDQHFRPQWSEARTRPTNNGGIPEARAIFGGWEVELMLDRVNGTADALMQFVEDNYVAGNADVNVTMQVTVRNADKTVDQYMYLDGIMYPTDGGSYKGTETVGQILKFFFKRRSITSTSQAVTLGGQPLGN